ncbi:Sap-like sulfolipid-1-addressing protein [Novosphingobium sp. PhB165]|uniref:GAP family protein n=1 Tax=Novosphingobium sp. PhB165 TaxID=2485105 RepID=UPI00104AD51B|nr:GAP family protein [Novosphingobium sp. PhB165]TCM17132.1 Sap-like sulfolipid-1-addressing protein [Novosphingobium sp. PhB165]
MLEAIGELLPLAVGLSISPLPIIAMIVLLMSPKAPISAPAFMLGWMIAIAAALILFGSLAGLGFGKGGSGGIVAAVKMALGAGLLLLALMEWRARPRRGETAQLPHWLEAVERMGPFAAGGLGFGIYAANPKNLTVGIAAGVAFGQTRLPPGQAALVCLVYVLIAASTVVVPVIGYFVARERVRPWLDEMRDWLTQHNAAVMAVLLLIVGAMMFGKGVSSLAG